MRSSTERDRDVFKWGLEVFKICTGIVLTGVENEGES